MVEVDGAVISKCQRVISTAHYRHMLKQKEEVEQMSSFLLSVYPVVGSVLSLVSLLISFFLLYSVLMQRLPKRRYSIMCSRLLSDSFSALLISLASALSPPTAATFTVFSLFFYLVTFGFVQLSLSHLLIILMRQVSLRESSRRVTSLYKILTVLIVGWTTSIIYSASFTPLATVLVSPQLSASICSYSSCQKPLLSVCLSLMIFLLITLLSFYTVVFLRLRKQILKERKEQPRKTIENKHNW